MATIQSTLALPMIVCLADGHRQVLDFTCLYRIQDTVLILNRIIKRWDDFHETLDSSGVWSADIQDAIRIEVIESTFSFINFFFLLAGFHKGIVLEIRRALSELSGDLASPVHLPPETGVIKDLRTLRNKMVAHSAHVDPRKEDSMDTRLAYLQWHVGYWGMSHDTNNRRLNTFGFGESDHAIPPSFADMVREAQKYVSLCEDCVRQHAEVLTQYLKTNKADEYAVVGEYLPD